MAQRDEIIAIVGFLIVIIASIGAYLYTYFQAKQFIDNPGDNIQLVTGPTGPKGDDGLSPTTGLTGPTGPPASNTIQTVDIPAQAFNYWDYQYSTHIFTLDLSILKDNLGNNIWIPNQTEMAGVFLRWSEPTFIRINKKSFYSQQTWSASSKTQITESTQQAGWDWKIVQIPANQNYAGETINGRTTILNANNWYLMLSFDITNTAFFDKNSDGNYNKYILNKYMDIYINYENR